MDKKTASATFFFLLATYYLNCGSNELFDYEELFLLDAFYN